MTLNALGWSRVNCQSGVFHPHCISTFQNHLMHYLDQDFTKLKYNDASALIIWRDQSHLNPHTDFTSTWLYPVAFHHCIRNPNSPIPKYNELLASHCGDLRSEGHLYSYLFRVTFDSRVLQSWSRSVKYTPIFYLHAIPVSSCFLVKRTTNLYGTQWPTLDMFIVLVIAYHLVANSFKD